MYLIINGKIDNFIFSKEDYEKKQSELIKKYEDGVFIWGTNRHYSIEKPGTKVLLYLSKDRSKKFNGGIVLAGEIKEVGELKEKYWPNGEWKYYIAIKVTAMPKSLIENNEPDKWKYVDRKTLEEKFKIRPLPGIQKISDAAGTEIEEMLKGS